MKDKDSLWRIQYERSGTNQLVSEGILKSPEKLYQPQRTVNLLSLLNSDHISYKEKNRLFVGKLKYDSKLPYIEGSRINIRTETTDSIEEAFNTFLRTNSNTEVNFWKSVNSIIIWDVDPVRNDSIVGAKVIKYAGTNLKEVLKFIKDIKIERLELAGDSYNTPHTLIIYQKKK